MAKKGLNPFAKMIAEKKDAKGDKKAGLKEGSKKDLAADAKFGFKKGGKVKGKC